MLFILLAWFPWFAWCDMLPAYKGVAAREGRGVPSRTGRDDEQ